MILPRRIELVLAPILLLSVANVQADTVVPSEAVVKGVIAREEARVDSNRVGKLKPNESAELLENVPYWYRVRLGDGAVGYVSKRWTDLIPAAQEAGAIIRLGAWNIKKLGHGTSKDFPLVASVIESNFDILAVIEVMQKGGDHPGYDDLINALGTNWSGIVTSSPRPNTNSGSAEYYAIIYRHAVVVPCDGWSALTQHIDNDGGQSETGSDHFSREPAFGCFQAPANDTTPGVDFMLAAY
jgi:hypothetical protein